MTCNRGGVPRAAARAARTGFLPHRTAMPAERSTAFDWSRYADATLAGLSVLIPVPFMDDAFEAFFRGRIPSAVARSRGQPLSPEVRRVLGEGEGGAWGCATLPCGLRWGC